MIIKKNLIKLKKCLKLNQNLKIYLKLNKNKLFFTNKNYLKVKSLIYKENKKQSQGNLLVDFFR